MQLIAHQCLSGEGLVEVKSHIAVVMAEKAKPPHHRGHLLWTADEGPSRLLLGSIDRWVGSIVADDGIEMPSFGRGDEVEATLFARGDGIIVGTCAVDHMLQIWAPSLKISWRATDGKQVSSGDEVATLSGDRESLLTMERSILNIIGYLSGIASEAKKWSSIAPGQIACTRKTVWGLLDKWAVHMGGGLTHRLNRNDATMIKENDLATMLSDIDGHANRITSYLQSVDIEQCGAFLEVEVREEKEAMMAAMIWSSRRSSENLSKLVIMLDNFNPERCKAVADEMTELAIREHVILEASGGITFNEINDWKECGLDILSTSTINRGVAPLDVSMLVNSS